MDSFLSSLDLSEIGEARIRVHVDGGRRIGTRQIDFDELDVPDQHLLGRVPGSVAAAAEDRQGGGQQGSDQGNEMILHLNNLNFILVLNQGLKKFY